MTKPAQPKPTPKELARAVSVASERSKQPDKKPTVATRVNHLENQVKANIERLETLSDVQIKTLNHLQLLEHQQRDFATSEELALLRDRVNRIDQRTQTDSHQLREAIKRLAPLNWFVASVGTSVWLIVILLAIVFSLNNCSKPKPDKPTPRSEVTAYVYR